MLLHRIIAALVGIPVIVYAIYSGGLVYFILIASIALISLWEYLTMLDRSQPFISEKIIACLPALFLLTVQYHFPASFGIVLILVILFYSGFLVFFFPHFTPWKIMSFLWGVLYIVGCLSFLLPLRALEQGLLFSVFLFVGIWANDTGAFFAGTNFGKRKLARKISPGKTIEGALGGILFTLVLLLLFGRHMKLDFPILFILSLLISLSGLLGDLLISALKRHFKVKDSGKVIPGHGGFLDRFDSIIFAAPLFYIFLLLLL